MKKFVEKFVKKYTETELSNMFDVFLEESGFYDYEWEYEDGNLKKDVLIWKKGTKHKNILKWFDKKFENGLANYMKSQWDVGTDEERCNDCPKLLDCCNCPFD